MSNRGTGRTTKQLEKLPDGSFFINGDKSVSDYETYRGKCKVMSEAWIAEHPEYELVRGWYYCPIWGEQQHWWTKHKETGEIHDPSKLQFPSKGIGEYVEFDGYFNCEQCGKRVHEKDCVLGAPVPICSGDCYSALVGVW